MKVTTYGRILERAKRLANRTGTLPAEEAASLRSFLATELESDWNSRWWPEFAVLEECTPTDQLVDRRIGEANEIGIIIGVYSADPRTAANYRLYPFAEHGEDIVIHSTAETVWVEYMPPPTKLDEVADEDLEDTEVPEAFAVPLSKKAAGYLLLGDGLTEQGNALLARGKEDADNLVLQLNFPRWWTRVVVNHCQ